MSRHTLVKAMAKNNDLLTFVVNLPVNYINTESTYQTLVSFWAATLVAYLDSRPSVTQQELSLFLPVLFVAVKARKFPDVQLAAYIVIASLTAKSLLMADAVATIIDLIALKPTAVPREYTTVTQASITTIVSICQRQEELSVFPQRAFSSLIARAGFFDVLKELHQSTDLTPFWRPFCKTLVEELYHPERTQNIESTCDTLLNLDSPPSAVLAKALFDRHVEDTAAEIESPALLVQTLSHLRQRYPESFNAAVREAAEADSAAVAKAVEAVMTSETGEVNGQGALDADENIRMLAFQQTLVDGSISQADTCAILKDRSPAITALLESHANVILAHIDPQEVVEICHAALQSDDLPRATLGHLCTFISQSFLKNHPEHETQVIIDLWPRLLWTKAGKRSTALVWTALAKSPLTNSDLKSCFESHGSPEAIGSQNRTLIEALSR